jgi:hypothetical protein
MYYLFRLLAPCRLRVFFALAQCSLLARVSVQYAPAIASGVKFVRDIESILLIFYSVPNGQDVSIFTIPLYVAKIL